jgi:hypothetical protein
VDDERELMISRRNSTLCRAVALLPLPTHSYDQFLNALRQRLIKLAGNGYVVEELAISPPQDGQRMTYGKFMRK